MRIRTTIMILLSLFFVMPVQAQEEKDSYYTGKVVSVQDEADLELQGYDKFAQEVTVLITNGPEKGKQIQISYGGMYGYDANKPVKQGDSVVLVQMMTQKGLRYDIADQYRLPSLGWFFVLFIVLSVLFARWKGVGSFLGLVISIATIIFGIVPLILRGYDPLWVTVTGGAFIAALTLFVAHGFSLKTLVALGGSFGTLLLSGILAILAVWLCKLSGTGSEEVLFLQSNPLFKDLNISGLLLSGILIGTLGVLDDITTAQAAVVAELKAANPSFDAKELMKRGLSVGNEHIASLVNTLALTYAGASLPLFLLFQLYSYQPLWVVLNSETIAEEIVRTIVGSIALVLAVPLTTCLAAWVFSKRDVEVSSHHHHH